MSVLGSLSPFLRGAVAALLRHRFALVALAAFIVVEANLDYQGAPAENWMDSSRPFQRGLGIANLRYIQGDIELFPRDHNKFYGAAFELPVVLFERAMRLEDTRDIHLSRLLLTHLFFLAAGTFAYLLTNRLFGNRFLALFTMLLFLLHPRVYVSFVNSRDLPFLSMFMIALFLTHRAFRKDTAWAFALLGASVGILTNLRIMGVVLVAGALAMLGVRLFAASGNEERKRTLIMGGVFIFAAGLTVYASMPYLWADPASRAIEWWTTLSQHPQNLHEVFSGRMISTQSPPIEYAPTWFSITTPPFVLLLGGIGGVALLSRGARLRSLAFRDERLRFGLLLVGCFTAPFLAIALLSPVVYGGWRQMFFLWAPFSLLAAFGMQWLTQALRRTNFRTLVYASTGAGISATIITMALLHPFQHYYFNFLLDRTAPENIKAQYRTNSWKGAYTVVKQLLDSQPSSQITVEHNRAVEAARLTLPQRDSIRLIPTHKMLAEFSIDRVHGEPPSDALYAAKAYNDTLWAITRRAPEENPYALVYEDAVSQEPHARSEYDLYVNREDHTLIYVKAPCAGPVMRDGFFLLVYPDRLDDLPEADRGLRRANLSFSFYDFGSAFDGKCVAEVPLPDYDVAAIRTGQTRTIDGDPRWEAAFPYQPPAAYRAAYASAASAEPDIRAAFNVHISESEPLLTYARGPCAPSDVENPFFIHIAPERESDLPPERKQHGFDNRDFDFLLNGIVFDGKCVAQAPLPDYPIASLRTGQFIRGEGEVWGVTLSFESP